MKLRSLFGPSTLVTAAFIGPGTLTTCTLAGIQHGYQLLWAVGFAAFATIVLQEMAARLGWASQSGLGEAIRGRFEKSPWKFVTFALVVSAILIGNAAYQAGNLSGAVIGLELLAGPSSFWIALVGLICFLLLASGRYQWLERLLIALVVGMTLCFLATALLVRPNLNDVVRGFIPTKVNGANIAAILSLVGTTVVPYNLFLHASTISKKWTSKDSLSELRCETVVAVLLGVAISVLIVVTSAATRQELAAQEITSAKAFAVQLQPVFGGAANVLLGIGFFSAGLTSALTAPMAAAYAARGLFGWPDNDRHRLFVMVWLTILLLGVAVAASDWNLIIVIRFAQIANAIVLPFVGIFLLRVANDRELMKQNANGIVSNCAGGLVLLILFVLSASSMLKVLQAFVGN